MRTRWQGRVFASAMAALLAASVLAVVAGSPVQAANTSGELLIDTNGDGVPDSREFAGSHRYDTAVRLAERFAADEGSASTVVIASGETEVDAVTAAGLAGKLNAPVLLTRTHQLPHNVARFINEHNATEVIVVGGTAAVPDAIVTAIEELDARPSVERISGADRYATATAIGNRLGGPNPTWCGSDQSAAILVNGGSAGRADAVISGPLAFRLGLPILLTMADEVPASTASFLTDNKVERVVIVGGTEAVSAGVVNALVEDIGVVDVQRIAGGSAAVTSVMVANEMLGNCAEVLGTNKDLVALVNRDAIADGITAAPVLGRGLGSGGSVPMLLVGGELPAAVSDYLASTAEFRAGHGKTHLGIVAIGGTAAVSGSVMADAVAAAKTSSALTATITPLTYTAAGQIPEGSGKSVGDYTTQFRVTFSDDVKLAVDGDDADTTVGDVERRGTVEDPKMYRLNGRRLEGVLDTETDNAESVSLLDLIYTADRTVTITLSHHLEAGDTITVDNSANEAAGLKLGANNDRRNLQPASLTLPAASTAADRSAPAVEIVAVANLSQFKVFVSEANLLHNEFRGPELANYLRIDPKDDRVDSISITEQDVTLFVNGRPDDHDFQFTTSVPLVEGDVITVERRAFIDEGGRGNPLTRLEVSAPKEPGDFEITRVSMGDYHHLAQASATVTSIGTDTDAKMRITAKQGGAADGAPGNDWVIYGYDHRPGNSADAKAASTNAFDIEVGVDTANQRISYTIAEVAPVTDIGRQASLLDLASALNANSDFAAIFSIDYVRNDDGSKAVEGQAKTSPLGGTDPAGVAFTRGLTGVGVIIEFNDVVESMTRFTTGQHEIVYDLLESLFASVVTVQHFVSFDRHVHIGYFSHRFEELPQRRAFRVIPEGRATNYHNEADTDLITLEGTPSNRKILNGLRLDSRIQPEYPVRNLAARAEAALAALYPG